MLVGYARVSTHDQELNLQRDALRTAGCERIFDDVASGAIVERLDLTRCLESLRDGDVLVVWKLDRLGRSLRHLVDSVTALQERGVGFRSLKDSLDTTSPAGRLVFHIFCALADSERDLIRERTMAGLAAARARGRKGGRKPKMTPKKLVLARQLYDAKDRSVQEIAELLGVDRSTVHRHLASERAVASTEIAQAG